MTKEQLQERLSSKQKQLADLQAAHTVFVEQFNKQVAQTQAEANFIQGAIKELEEQLADVPA